MNLTVPPTEHHNDLVLIMTMKYWSTYWEKYTVTKTTEIIFIDCIGIELFDSFLGGCYSEEVNSMQFFVNSLVDYIR